MKNEGMRRKPLLLAILAMSLTLTPTLFAQQKETKGLGKQSTQEAMQGAPQAACAFSWLLGPSATGTAGQLKGFNGTFFGLATGYYRMIYSLSGSLALNNLQVSWTDNGVLKAVGTTVFILNTTVTTVQVTGTIPFSAVPGTTATITMNVLNILGQVVCASSVDVTVTAPPLGPGEIAGVGWEAQGAGMAIRDINGNGLPDMVLMAIDNPPGQNNFRYKVGWDIDANGNTPNWSSGTQVSGLGWEAQGGGVDFTNLDSDPKPEMILMAIDNPPGQNTFKYKVGWNVNSTGIAASWSNVILAPGLGWEAQGGGVRFTNLDTDSRPEMVLMVVDNPPGQNTFKYKIGWNVDSTGVAASWSNAIILPGVGWEAQGAGVDFTNLDNDPKPEMLIMAIDNPSGPSTFRYRIGWNLDSTGVATSWSNTFITPGVGWFAQGGDIDAYDIDNDTRPEFLFMAYDSPPGPNNFRLSIVQW